MILWLSKSSDVPLHEQLKTQIVLGIVSGDLAAGERVPTTGELARRFHLHPNTARRAYRDLVTSGWLEWRKGSGFYVQTLSLDARLKPELELDRFISRFFQTARERGYSLKDLQSRMARWLSMQPPDHVVVIEPEPELREILVAEIAAGIDSPATGVSVDECRRPGKLTGGLCVALYDSTKVVQPALPPEVSCLYLRSRSISNSLMREIRPDANTLIIVISRWPSFLNWARTVLVAINIDPDVISLRDARKKGWERGLTQRDFVITDALLAERMPKNCRAHVFRVISDESLAELRRGINHRATETRR